MILFLNFYVNELPEDNKYNLTTDLIKSVKDLHNIGNIFLETTEWLS